MGVVSVNEIWDGRAGSTNDQGVREYTRSFRVRTDDARDGVLHALYAAGIPRRYDPYEDQNGAFDTGALAKHPRARGTEDPTLWIVEVDYSTKYDFPEGTGAASDKPGTPSAGQDGSPGDKEGDPIFAPAKIKWGTVKYTKPARAFNPDGSRSAILNSAGLPFDPPPEMEDYRLTLTVARTELAYTVSTNEKYVNRVNRAQWKAFNIKPLRMLCKGISADREYKNGIVIWNVQYEFEYREEGWALQLLNCGWDAYDADYDGIGPAERHRIVNTADGHAPRTPPLLDARGQELDPDDDPIYLVFHIYETAEFNDLKIK